jgi:hypothetical protein
MTHQVRHVRKSRKGKLFIAGSRKQTLHQKFRALHEGRAVLLDDIGGHKVPTGRLYRGFYPNETVYTVLKHTSSSGMFRKIDAFVIRDSRPMSILAALNDEDKAEFLKIYPLDREERAFRVRGTGMDMGFAIVYTLSQIVFKNYPAATKERSAGYILSQSWL